MDSVPSTSCSRSTRTVNRPGSTAARPGACPLPEEMYQLGIYFARVRPVQAVRRALNRDQLASLDDFRRALGRDGEGHDTIRIAVDNQRGHIDACEVVPEVRR